MYPRIYGKYGISYSKGSNTRTKVTQKDQSECIGVPQQAISEYKKTSTGKKKLELMLKGLEYMELNQIELLKLRK